MLHQPPIQPPTDEGPDEAAINFYRKAMHALGEAGVPFLVGGAYALAKYAGIVRHTKDFDVFCRREDRDRALDALTAMGCKSEVPFPHWLAKAHHNDLFVDVIYSSGNGVARVDDEWFAHAEDAKVLGVPAKLVPPEEIIWSKAFVVERERYDGADINHLIRSRGDRFDWDRLLGRFGDHWPVLLSHLILYRFAYPAERDRVPAPVLRELLQRARKQAAEPGEKVCRGTLLSRAQYLKDIEDWGYEDARLAPKGNMTPEELAPWHAAIFE